MKKSYAPPSAQMFSWNFVKHSRPVVDKSDQGPHRLLYPYIYQYYQNDERMT